MLFVLALLLLIFALQPWSVVGAVPSGGTIRVLAVRGLELDVEGVAAGADRSGDLPRVNARQR